MGRRDRQKAKIDEDGGQEIPMKSMAELSGSDDDEANEDLSLKIVQKSLLKRAAKSSPDQFVPEDVDGGNGIGGGTVDLNLSPPPLIAEAVVGPSGTDGDTVVSEVEDGKSKRKNKKERKKKSKVDKSDVTEKIVVAAKEGELMEEVKATDTIESADPNAVETIPDNIVLRKLLRGPRYFDPPDSSWGTCYNCGEEGHTAVNCTLARRKKPCFVCGSFEHGVRNCTKGYDCFICKKGGHRAKDCPDKYKKSFQTSQICLKCGGSGHEMFSCRNDYSSDDLKEIQCYICKKFGHLCCINSSDSGSGDLSCYKCGQLGHTGLACNWVHGETGAASSPSLCYRCGEGGHFARECTSSSKAGKRNREFSTPAKRFSREGNEYLGFQSAPNELVKARKKKKTRHEERGFTTPRKSKHKYIEDPEGSRKSKHKYIEDPEDIRKSKHRGGWSTEDPGEWRMSKHRGGWSTEDPGDFSYKKSKRSNYASPATPTGKGHKISTITAGGQISSSRSPKKTWNHNYENSPSQGSGNSYHHRYSASRFGSSSNNGGSRRQSNW